MGATVAPPRRRWTRWRKIVTFGSLAYLAWLGVFGGPSGRESLAIIVALWAYMLPAWIAGWRHRPNAGAVFVIDVFLGWTGIGWIIALAMAAG